MLILSSNNHNPVWQTPVKIEYKFEVYQKILLLVGDGDATKIEPIGTVVSIFEFNTKVLNFRLRVTKKNLKAKSTEQYMMHTTFFRHEEAANDIHSGIRFSGFASLAWSSFDSSH